MADLEDELLQVAGLSAAGDAGAKSGGSKGKRSRSGKRPKTAGDDDDEDSEEGELSDGSSDDDRRGKGGKKAKKSSVVPLKKRIEKSGDDDFDDGYGSDLMGDAEDRKKLMAMTELEREQILLERAEKRNKENDRRKLLGLQGETPAKPSKEPDSKQATPAAPPADDFDPSQYVRISSRTSTKQKAVLQQLVAKKRAGEEKRPSARKKTPSTSSGSSGDDSDSDDSDGPSARRKAAARKKKGAGTKARDDDDEDSDGPPSGSDKDDDDDDIDDDDDDDEDEEVDELLKDAKRAPRRGAAESARDLDDDDGDAGRDGGDRDDENIEMATPADLRLITLRRSQLENWFLEPYFNTTVTNCLVFIKSQVQSQDKATTYRYKIWEIVGVVELADKPYKVGPVTTNKHLKLKRGILQDDYQVIEVSNYLGDADAGTLGDEWRKYIERLQRDKCPLMTKEQVLERLDALRAARNYTYKPEDVKKILEEKKKVRSTPFIAVKELENLRSQLEAASERGDKSEVAELEAKIKKLEKKRNERDRLKKAERKRDKLKVQLRAAHTIQDRTRVAETEEKIQRVDDKIAALKEKEDEEAQLDAAQEQGDSKKVDKLEARIKELEAKLSAFSEDSDDEDESLNKINERNKLMNAKVDEAGYAKLQAQIAGNASGGTVDPFSRRWTRSQNYWTTKRETGVKVEEEEKPVKTEESDDKKEKLRLKVRPGGIIGAISETPRAGDTPRISRKMEALEEEMKRLHSFDLDIDLSLLSTDPTTLVPHAIRRFYIPRSLLNAEQEKLSNHTLKLTVSDYKRRMGLV